MKKMRIIIAIMLMTTMFCIGCSKKDEPTESQTSQQQTDEHDHEHGEDSDHTH